jgi:hypothetical protein
MAVRIPLKIVDDSSASFSLQDCSAAEIVIITNEMIRQYGANPSATLAVGTGNLGNIADTRLKAGAAGSDATNFDTTGELADVSTVTVNYNKLVGAFFGTSAPSIGVPTAGATYSFPCYQTTTAASASIQPFTAADMIDTFWHPAATRLVAATAAAANTAGTYTITTSTTAASGFTNVSTTPIFTDTRANAGAYTAAGLPETVDQPTTITNYYLHRTNSASAASPVAPYLVCLAVSGGLPQAIPHAALGTQLQDCARYAAINEASYRIQYAFAASTSGFTTRATALDTKLNSSAYLTLQVSDDYRSQEVPAGSATTVTTYNFGIKLA